MNYSTLKKGLAVSFVAMLGVTSIASAQDAATTSSTKVFGGSGQYRTWSLGVNAGVLAPMVATGGANDFNAPDLQLGYGISLKKQLGHVFGIEGNIFRGKLKAHYEDIDDNVITVAGNKDFKTDIAYAADLRAVINIGSIDFLRRENSVNFFVTAGYGLTAFNPILNGVDRKGTWGKDQDKEYIKQAYIPVGVGVKFKVSERVAFNLGYTEHFVDGDNLDALYRGGPSNDKFSYGYAGLEFSLGSSAKPSLEWANPLALMYDELKDPSLRQEVEALKNRVANVEKAVEDLKKDSDGDGVSDQFDKCPGTPAGTAVDGSGCPLPKAEVVAPVSSATGFETIQFEFNSSVLKTEAYPTLDKLSSVLRENGGKVTVNGYASSEGTAAYNLKLSKDRANSVKTYLVNTGVNASQVATKGNGEANPVASNDTEEGRIQNRRVETARN